MGGACWAQKEPLLRFIVDGDACPVKDMILRAANRLKVEMVLVSNNRMAFGQEPGVREVIVAAGADEADRWIAEEATAEDLVITADIPLAAKVVDKGGIALGHRGEVFDGASIGERIATWTLNRELREQGLDLGGPKGFNNTDRQAFAAGLEQLVQRLQRQAAKKPRP